MFGYSREDWSKWLMGALITFLVGRALQWLSVTLGGLNLSAAVLKLSDPNVQALMGELLLPAITTSLYLVIHWGNVQFDSVAKITLCSMSAGYILVFILNLGRPDNSLLAQLAQDPLSAIPIFFIPVFYLMHSVLKTIVENRV